MSSNSTRRPTRLPSLAPLLLAGLLGACASDPYGDAPRTPRVADAVTPTEQYPLRAQRHDYRILLAPHVAGLSPAQKAALARVAYRWRETGTGLVSIREPDRRADPRATATTGLAARAELIALGVPAERIQRESYEPQADAPPAVVVSFGLAEALVPECGRDWENLTSNAQNRPMNNFGCAISANMAAQIADPADITGPRPSGPADVTRRMTVLGKYQQGVQTGSDDKQATVSVSGVAAGGGD